MVSLLAGGDIMLSRNIGYYNKREGYDRIFGSGSYHPLSAFPNCNPQHCLLFFNLESPFHPKDNDIQKGGFTFRANVKNIQVLKDLQTSQRLPLILSLANNHLNNGGYQGVKTTRELLLQHDILPVGAGLTQAEAGFRSVMLQGMKLCFAAYSYDGKIDLQAGGGKFSRNPLNPDQIVTDIQAMGKSWCDAKILSLHWGREYGIRPNQRQRDLAHRFIDAGADLILGAHAHVPGEIEQYQGKYIFYSLGNFIFDQERGKKARGAEFDYIYDAALQRKTVPTYIALLAQLHIVKKATGIEILLGKLHFDTVSKGLHQPLDSETAQQLTSLLRKGKN